MKGNVKIKTVLFDKVEMNRLIEKIADEIKMREKETPVLVGIKTRGVPIALRIKKILEEKTGKKVEWGELDITFYRDDLTLVDTQPVVKGTSISTSIDNRVVVLVDDVLFTGRTVRAALDELLDFGRPKAVRLAVLIDRGHRELPICADYIGSEVKTSLNEIVIVKIDEVDGEDVVLLGEREVKDANL